MIDRTTKLRLRRKVKRRQKQIEGIGSQTEENLDKHFFRRLGRLYEVRRFLVSWLLLLVVVMGAVVIQTRALGNYYLKVVPVPGGIYSEGIIGSYSNANPIYATTDVDMTVSRLLFSGLLMYDKNNKLVGDTAKSWSVDETGKVYTVVLRDDVQWHDGAKLTAEDVVFTYRTIQNPDARSPFFSSWQGIKIEATDEHTVVFTLSNVLASFPHSLTGGLLPRHKLRDLQANELRGSLFNTVEPIGTGPFRWNGVEVRGNTADDREQRIALSAYDKFHRGRPKINEFIVRAFLEENPLIQSYKRGELNAVAGALSMPLDGSETEELTASLTGGVMIFLRNTQEILSDAKVRRALTMATNRSEIIRSLQNTSNPVDGPLLQEHIGYDPNITQHGFDIAQANALLDEAGWVLDQASGVRMKDGKKLSLVLNTLSSAEYAGVASIIQRQWRSVGVDLSVNSLAQRDLQTVIDERGYDALIYGIVMGSDPDQFAYWHSSQADIRSQRRLNFSDYKSGQADAALEAGRTRTNVQLRAAKYTPFLQAWRDDAPAIALYRPRFIYTTYSKLYNFDVKHINSPVDRFANIENWMFRTDRAIVP